MKKLIIFCLAVLALASCDDDDLGPNNPNVVADENLIELEELVLLVTIQNANGQYLAVQSIDSLAIYVNNQFWAKPASEPLNLDGIETEAVNGLPYSEEPLSYLVLAEQTTTDYNFETAGEYADYLTSSLVLEPGDYVVYLDSLTITLADGTTQTYYPRLYKVISVQENKRSVYVGEFTLTLN
jgi:hypothetical protein